MPLLGLADRLHVTFRCLHLLIGRRCSLKSHMHATLEQERVTCVYLLALLIIKYIMGARDMKEVTMHQAAGFEEY